MALFRKKETYNEQMLRAAGLDRVVFKTPQPAAAPPSASPANDPPQTLPADRLWDTATTVTAPGIAGNHVEFAVLPNGDLIVEREEGDGDLSPLADAIEERLDPPYTAAASRQDGDLWGVGAKQIEVAEFAFPAADTLVLTQNAGVTELVVDGESSDAAPPAGLQRLGAETGSDFSVEASRLDGDFWEVKVSLL